MKRLLLLACFVTLRLSGQTLLTDDFSGGSLDTGKWQVTAPMADSLMYASAGNAVFFQRGTLISQADFSPGIQITGSFAFTGGVHDGFWIPLRTDGTVLAPHYNFQSNIYVGFNRQGSDNGDKVGIENIYIAAGTAPAFIGSFSFTQGASYDFKIVDDGTQITLFLADLNSPFGSASTTERDGYKLGLQNRGTVPWFPTTDNEVRLSSFTVTAIPEPSTFAAVAGLLALAIGCRSRCAATSRRV